MNRSKAKKSLGQNFLVDASAIAKIVSAIPEGAPLLLEIGPGQGALTLPLAQRAQKLLLLEKDEMLLADTQAKAESAGTPVAAAWPEDALEFDWQKIWQAFGLDQELYVAANLPYNVATEILFRLLALQAKIPLMVLMFQKEVAERIAAGPRGRDRGTISIFAQNFYDTEVIAKLKPESFRPRPKIDSAVVLFRRKAKPVLHFSNEREWASFRELVQNVFRFRRKTLSNGLQLAMQALSQGPAPFVRDRTGNITATSKLLHEINIDAQRRPETLSIEEWGNLYQALMGGAFERS